MTTRRGFLKGSAIAGAAIAASRVPHEALAAASHPSPELEEVTIADLQKLQESGAQSSEQLTQAYLNRIEAIDLNGPKLNSVIEVNPDALSIARQHDSERKAGKVRGPMHGIPVLIKDNIATADRMQTTAGSLALVGAGAPGDRDAFVAAQLRRAGAVILGKTNLSEWANFRSNHSSSGWSGRGGQTNNPYALDRNPSGSSSGSGAATSANLCAIAVGTETDGSIVSPSCSNGLVGIKPTVGLVSRAGIVPISHTQDTAGPMARSVSDAAILLTALYGPDENDPATGAMPDTLTRMDYTKYLDPNGLRGMRIGAVRKFAGFNAQADKLFNESIDVMRKLGAVIVDPVEIATDGKFGDAEMNVLLYEFKADLNKYLASLGAKSQVHSLADVIKFNNDNSTKEMPYFGQELLVRADGKGGLDSDEYKKALADCKKMTQADGIDAALQKDKLDLLIGITGGPAWMTDLVDGDGGLFSDSSLPAVAGYPHITVPMGMMFGLPLNISFIGTAWSEPTLLKAAYAYEQATKHRTAPKFLATASLG